MRAHARDERGLRAGPIALWQAGLVAGFAVAAAATGRGSVLGCLAGAALLHASMRLTAIALRTGLKPSRHAGVALGLLLAKLALLLGVAVIGLTTRWLAPMSLAAGAATLPMAIVLDTCYLAWANRRGTGHHAPPAQPPKNDRWNIP